MDARAHRFAVALAALALMGAGYRTQNFIVTAADPALAEQVARQAEVFRRDLAIEWLGRELPPWPEPCVLQVNLHRDAFGATTFYFSGPGGMSGTPAGWQMEVNGSAERILDSVLPHEVTHTILASHFRRRLPRWLDEGASSCVEHYSETIKQERNLLHYLSNGKGIPFDRMFAMMEYPHDMLPLYAQGLSVVKFLLHQGGKPTFVRFVQQGLDSGDWERAVQDVYGYAGLSDLQFTWNGWVGEGSPDLSSDPNAAVRFVATLRDGAAGDGAAGDVAASEGALGQAAMPEAAMPGAAMSDPGRESAPRGGFAPGSTGLRDVASSVSPADAYPATLDGRAYAGGSLAPSSGLPPRSRTAAAGDLTDSWYFRQAATTVQQRRPQDPAFQDPAIQDPAFNAPRVITSASGTVWR